MAFYVRLKKGIVEAPYYGVFIYPGDEYIAIEDKFLSIVQKDIRVEILNQEQMSEIVENEQELIIDIRDGQWKQSEKRINEIKDVKFLEYKLLPELIKTDKKKLIQITKDKISELTVIK